MLKPKKRIGERNSQHCEDGQPSRGRMENKDGFPSGKSSDTKPRRRFYLISSKRGQTEVTQDHSIIVDGKSVKPFDFISNNMQFQTLRAEKSTKQGRTIDLLPYVKEFRRTFISRCGKGGRGSYLTDNYIAPAGKKWIRIVNKRKNINRMRRYYKPGTPVFYSFLKILAIYIAEGSASIKKLTTRTRDMFSLCQNDIKWLRAAKKDSHSHSRQNQAQWTNVE